ncbi:MAG TPA: LysR substrate-binding domain-containing protein [Rubrobacter sp.]|nr:LysR substrate-binding domain-containing protein [Rubrobacter sp.]
MGFSVQALRVYLCILECGSLSAAGRELGMTQPAVSNHLHALEERFGVALLTRGRPLRATPAGESLAEHARRVLDEVSALEAEMASHTAPHGPLVVGASSTPGELLMPGLAAEFSARHPEVALELRVYDTDEAIAALLGREIEAAVVGHEVDDPRLAGTVVGRDALVAVVAASDRLPGTEISPGDLADRPFVLREQGSGTRRTAEEGLAAVGVRPRVAMELGSNAAVAGAVAAGAGVGVVPLRTAGALKGVRQIEVRGLAFSRPFVLLTERGRRLSPAAQAFVANCAREECS